MLSAPGNNEGHLMREAPQDADGRFWVSAPPPQDWEPFGKVCGSTDAKVVTWLDLTDSISRIEGLVAAPADREIFDLDGIRIIPTTAEWELFNSKNDPSMGRTLKDDMEEDSELNEENFDPWRREQEKSIVIGTPPAPSPDQCIIQPTSDRFSYTADVSDGVKYKSDAEDAALPRTVDAGAQGHPWRVPMQKLTGLTVWSGTYLHGFQFHAGSGASSPFWGKCGGKPTARWNVNTSHDQGPESCVSEPFLFKCALFRCCYEQHQAHVVDTFIPSICHVLTPRGEEGFVLKAVTVRKTGSCLVHRHLLIRLELLSISIRCMRTF